MKARSVPWTGEGRSRDNRGPAPGEHEVSSLTTILKGQIVPRREPDPRCIAWSATCLRLAVRHRPKHAPTHPHVVVPLPRVRKLSRGVHFGIACIGFFFVAMIVYWLRFSGAGG